MKILPLFLAFVVAAPALQAAPAKAPGKIAPKKKPAKPIAPQWKPATAAQRQAVATVIRAQLDAFKRNDWEKAATYQAEGLRRNFGSTARFREVITMNYPQFANYSTVAFDRARALGDRVEIAVRLTGKDKVKLRAVYTLVKEKGMYRVAGVVGGEAAPGQDLSDYI